MPLQPAYPVQIIVVLEIVPGKEILPERLIAKQAYHPPHYGGLNGPDVRIQHAECHHVSKRCVVKINRVQHQINEAKENAEAVKNPFRVRVIRQPTDVTNDIGEHQRKEKALHHPAPYVLGNHLLS